MENRLFQEKLTYFTTPYLMSLFAYYKSPRDKIKHLTKSGDLIHIKQGLYISGQNYNRKYSREVISGMLYGPSAISMEYALSFHGLIPERVEKITGICFKRDKSFNTPIGMFSYKYLPIRKYTIGIEYHRTKLGNFFMAAPEKALCDKVYFSTIKDKSEVPRYLLEELRIDIMQLQKLDINLLTRLSEIYKRKNTVYLLQTIAGLQAINKEN
ncbi:MAG: hypothetical protein KAQ69_03360 [Spirochaetales bacterium]|nr:hypothetical protein [Spirochaetales bacterium]